MKKRIYFTLKSNICKDCPTRTVGCHGKCESYIKECEERNKLKQLQHIDKVNYRHSTFENKLYSWER